MVGWSKASYWHEMLCHDPEIMGSKPGEVELGRCIVHLSETNNHDS